MDPVAAPTRPRAMRVLGEISIIVVGVLIALGADGLREFHADRRLAQSYLGSLATELRADSAEFARMLLPGALPAQQAATDSLIQILGDPESTPDGATVLSYLRAQILLPFATKRRASYDDLIGSGRLGLIRDPELRRELVDYYSRAIVTDQSGYDAFLTSSFYPFTHHLTQVLGPARYVGMAYCDVRVGVDRAADACYRAASLGDELELLRGDPELGALVTDQVMQRFFALDGVQQAQAQVVSLLGRLREGAP